MNALLLPRVDSTHLIDEAIARHGAMRVLSRALTALIRHRLSPRPPDADALGPHLRRDIGLPAEPRPMDLRRYML